MSDSVRNRGEALTRLEHQMEPRNNTVVCIHCGAWRYANANRRTTLFMPGNLLDGLELPAEGGVSFFFRVDSSGCVALLASEGGRASWIASREVKEGMLVTQAAFEPPCLCPAPHWQAWLAQRLDELLRATGVLCSYCRAQPGQWCRLGLEMAVGLHGQRLQRLWRVAPKKTEVQKWERHNEQRLLDPVRLGKPPASRHGGTSL